MNPATYAAVGITTTQLASLIVYLSHWPLQPIDQPVAQNIASMLIAGFALFHSYRINCLKNPPPPPAPPPSGAPSP